MLLQIFIGLLGSAAIAGAAYMKRSLSVSGVLAAIAVGTVIYALGSLVWFGTLIIFFLSSSLLSKLKRGVKQTAESGYEKSGRRDAGQVAANGALAAVLCAANYVWPHDVWWVAFVAVMAAVTADTWATEIGGLNRKPPRSILSGQRVPPGTSGGVSPLGFAATLLGGAFIGASAWLLAGVGPSGIPEQLSGLTALLALGTLGGAAGSLTDSFIGAKWQRMSGCPGCGRDVEATRHCGRDTVYRRGCRWLGNDVVNVLSSFIAAIMTTVVWFLAAV